MRYKIFMNTLAVILFALAATQAGTLPDFKLRDIKNQWQKFDDVKGEKLTVIDFWATWCGPCKRALPKLSELSDKYLDSGVAFVGLNIDSPKNSAKVAPFVKANKIKYAVLVDPNGEFSSLLNINSIPTLLIINDKKEIVFRHTGYAPGDEKLIEKEIIKNANLQ